MKKSMKRVIALLLTVLLIASTLAACSVSTGSEEVIKIGVCQLVQHEALDAATQGFQDAVEAKLDNVQVDVQNASGDSATCSTITNQFVADGVDLIMANATPALQAAMQSTTTIPIVATSITDYATALEADDWNGTTGINVTGTSDLAPLADQAAMIKELFPDCKTVGILYCSAEPNSIYQATVMTEELSKLDITAKEFTAADTNDIASVTKTACDSVDVLYIPTDNTMASSTGTIDPIASDAGIPIVTGEEGICKGCGIATLSIDYYSIGYAAGEMAVQILTEGTDPGTMEIGYATDLTKEYVADRATALDVAIPEGYTAISTEEE